MILDTNALSALAGKDPKILKLIESQSHLVLNIISLGEYQYGIDGSRNKDVLNNWLEKLVANAVVLQPTMGTLPFYSAIRHELKQAGTPIPANDVWIAALCREHRLKILSRDRHFDVVNKLKRISW